jgi:RNA polymerase sigma factor for flagellar operon FliA
MIDRLNPEALFLEHLSWIDKVASAACSKHGVWGDEAEDFITSMRIKLMENDYAILRKFRGTSQLKTYLAAVIVRYFYEFERTRRGRWRSSAVAERLGTPARELEMLVHRDGYALEEAGEKLRAAGRTTLSDAELARLLKRLPPHAPLRSVEVGAAPLLETAPDASRTDERMTAAGADTRRREMRDALEVAMNQLDPEEQLIVRMHFADGHSVADVARALRLEQKPLYRRLDRLRARLRVLLESEGLRQDDVRGVLSEHEAP